MTENQALEFDAAARKIAAVALCTGGPEVCPGRNAQTVPHGNTTHEPIMMLVNGNPDIYRCADGGRRYRCRFCQWDHVFGSPGV